MSEHNNKLNTSAVAIFSWSLLVLVLYALSLGPVVYIALRFGQYQILDNLEDTVYVPLIWLDQNVYYVGKFYDWYSDLF